VRHLAGQLIVPRRTKKMHELFMAMRPFMMMNGDKLVSEPKALGDF